MNWLRRLIWLCAPGLAAEVRAFRVRRRTRSDFRKSGLCAILARLRTGDGYRVLDGPFVGMRYVDEAVGSSLLPKLLGTYELEIRPWIDRLSKSSFDVLIDIGCAEGYYAVGMALKGRVGRVIGYDVDPHAIRTCRHMAALNDVVEQIDLRKFATGERLAEDVARQRALIICDCEGAEIDFFTHPTAIALSGATILVELHEFLRPGSDLQIRRTFGATHQIEEVRSTPRALGLDLPVYLPKEEAMLAVDEHRPAGQTWLLLSPVGSPSANA